MTISWAVDVLYVGPIGSMFWENESMSDCIYLDGVVCVVEGASGLEVRHPASSLLKLLIFTRHVPLEEVGFLCK